MQGTPWRLDYIRIRSGCSCEISPKWSKDRREEYHHLHKHMAEHRERWLEPHGSPQATHDNHIISQRDDPEDDGDDDDHHRHEDENQLRPIHV